MEPDLPQSGPNSDEDMARVQKALAVAFAVRYFLVPLVKWVVLPTLIVILILLVL